MLDEKIINEVEKLYKPDERTALLIDDIKKLLKVAYERGWDDGSEAVNTVIKNLEISKSERESEGEK